MQAELQAANDDAEAALRRDRALERERDLRGLSRAVQGVALRLAAALVATLFVLAGVLAADASLAVQLQRGGLSLAASLAAVAALDVAVAITLLACVFFCRARGAQPHTGSGGVPVALLLERAAQRLLSA
jgi:hypothetical protein